MALQTSGAISLNDIHVEAGGGSGSSASINDSDIRGLRAAPGRTIPTGSGTTIDFADFYGASNLLPMSTSNFMRQASSGTSAYAVYSTRSRVGSIVFNVGGGYYVRLRRSDPYVYLEIREQSSSNYSLWYNTSGGASSLSTGYRQMGRFNLSGVTSIALDWTTPSVSGSFGTAQATGTTFGATYSASDNSFRNISNGQSIGFYFKANVNAECYQSNTINAYTFLTARARKSGYVDGVLGSYLLRARGYARATACF
tara:strand:+ start:71 stop:835 length:765 start_codon:yes stop_codon:yes gene_type:complete